MEKVIYLIKTCTPLKKTHEEMKRLRCRLRKIICEAYN